MPTLNNQLRTDLAEQLNTRFGGGVLEIRTATGGGGSLLCSITLPATPFSVTNGVATRNGTWSGTASGTGTAGGARIRASDSSRTLDLSLSATGGGGETTLDNTSIASGQTVTINTVTITVPAS